MKMWGVWLVNDLSHYPGAMALKLYWRRQDAVRYWKAHETPERPLIVRELEA